MRVSSGSGFGAAKRFFELAPHFLDRIEVGRVGWKEKDAGSELLDERKGWLALVRREIVHDYDVTQAQARAEHLFDIGAEDFRVGGTFRWPSPQCCHRVGSRQSSWCCANGHAEICQGRAGHAWRARAGESCSFSPPLRRGRRAVPDRIRSGSAATSVALWQRRDGLARWRRASFFICQSNRCQRVVNGWQRAFAAPWLCAILSR